MKTNVPPAAVCLALLLAAPPSARALGIRTFNAAAHLRINGFPANPVVNPTFFNPGGRPAAQLDLSGIGWSVQDPRKQLTLVSPRHFVGANHFRPAAGSTVRFLATDNTLHTLTVATTSTIPNDDASASDVFLGEFTTELPTAAAVLPLPYLNLATEAAYAGEAIIGTGQAGRGGRGTIGSVSDFGGDPITGGAGIRTRAFTFTYALAGTVDDAFAEGGDSGSPSLANRSGKAALVGTHTAVLNALGTTTTYDTLVPHYAPELNSRMESSGLRLRKMIPPVVFFSLTGAATDSTVRTGEPFTCRFTVTNTSSAEADNVAARFSFPPGLALTQISAAGWHDNAIHSVRRGGLAAGAAATFEISFAAAPKASSVPISLEVKSDGYAPQTIEFPVTVLPSYAAWSAGLATTGLDDDSDHDGIPNLIEYACGGDHQTASHHFPGTGELLLPAFLIGSKSLSFIRRTDAVSRGLTYRVQRSTDLQAGSWQTLEIVSLAPVSVPAPGFERVNAALPGSVTGMEFFRLLVELSE